MHHFAIPKGIHTQIKGFLPQDSMPILETRSKIKVTMKQGWYATLCHPKMHAQTKFGLK